MKFKFTDLKKAINELNGVEGLLEEKISLAVTRKKNELVEDFCNAIESINEADHIDKISDFVFNFYNDNFTEEEVEESVGEKEDIIDEQNEVKNEIEENEMENEVVEDEKVIEIDKEEIVQEEPAIEKESVIQEEKKPKAKKEKSKKKQDIKKDKELSNKGQIFLAWNNGKGETDVDLLLKLVDNKVKKSTIKGWINSWKNGKNLPVVKK